MNVQSPDSRYRLALRVKQVASLSLSLRVLYELAIWCGIPVEDPILDHFGAGEGTYTDELHELAASSIIKSRKSTPGRSLVEALSRLLASGRAHLCNPTTPGAPPFVARTGDNGGAEVAALNQRLGWSYDPSRSTWVPGGNNIGYFGTNAAGEQVALFDTVNAFSESKRQYPNLIPHGQTGTVSWESVWSEGLTPTAASRRKESVASRMSLGEDSGEETESVRLSGVPVLVEHLLSATQDD